MTQFVLNGLTLDIPDRHLNDALRTALQSGRYEGAESFAVAKHLSRGERVLELGTGAGYLAMQIALRVGAENLMTVEASPKLIPVIEANLARNDIDGVEVLNGAVVPDDAPDDTVSFYMTAAFWASSLDPELARKWASTKAVEVPALKFGTLLARHRPGVVVMDIEGGEQYLFDLPLPDHVWLVVVELHPRTYPDTAIKHIFDRLSASGLTYCPAGSRGDVVVFRRVGMAE